MRKKTVLSVLILFSLFLIIFSEFSDVFGGTVRTPGVKPGDFNIYRVYTSFNSSDPGMKPENAYSIFGVQSFFQIDSFSVIVANISDSTIFWRVGTTFKNETETTTHGWIDIYNGDSSQNLSEYGVLKNWFISTNLTVGDSLYSPVDTGIINETIPLTYLGVLREINHGNWTMQGTGNGDIFYTCSLNVYYDRPSGSLTEWCVYEFIQNQTYSQEMYASFTLEASNVIPEFPSFLIMPLFMLATLLVIIVYKKRV